MCISFVFKLMSAFFTLPFQGGNQTHFFNIVWNSFLTLWIFSFSRAAAVRIPKLIVASEVLAHKPSASDVKSSI